MGTGHGGYEERLRWAQGPGAATHPPAWQLQAVPTANTPTGQGF